MLPCYFQVIILTICATRVTPYVHRVRNDSLAARVSHMAKILLQDHFGHKVTLFVRRVELYLWKNVDRVSTSIQERKVVKHTLHQVFGILCILSMEYNHVTFVIITLSPRCGFVSTQRFGLFCSVNVKIT